MVRRVEEERNSCSENEQGGPITWKLMGRRLMGLKGKLHCHNSRSPQTKFYAYTQFLSPTKNKSSVD